MTPNEEELLVKRRKFLFEAMRLCKEDSDAAGFVVRDRSKEPTGTSGEITCPLCGAVLRYSRATSNGHLWGQCTTEGCLAWMQ